MCKFSLYKETKIPIRLNIFDPKDFWKTYVRLMEDFDLGGKPKLFQNLGRNHKFYLNLGAMCLTLNGFFCFVKQTMATNIHFDYEGHYTKSGDDYEWIPSDCRLFGISLKTSSLDEITYSFLKERICKKMTIYPCTKSLKLSYIPLVVENVVDGEADEGGIGLDNRDSVNDEGNVDNSTGIGAISDYVELQGVAKEIPPAVTEWEDGLGFEMFQEFPSKVAVKDLIDRGSQHNSFGISIVNSDNTIVHSDYPGLFETPTPKTLVGLVQRRLGVEVSYASVWRGKKQDVEDMRGSPEEGYKKVPSYLVCSRR
ncbi:unnamed protein product [Brassica oleracea var. botrytis]|uniref:Uncharacterized protein n=2 Tax=Brassica TaxID=3705 RepID=A0A3P6G445_BRAOL|nr:unnamed protein product [Brassica napus]VDD54364.1 unnamed protein product [Brassica oleracea]